MSSVKGAVPAYAITNVKDGDLTAGGIGTVRGAERGADRRMAHRTPRLTEQPENHGGTPIRPAVVFPQKTVGIASIPQRPH
jgi:hypothetical protein